MNTVDHACYDAALLPAPAAVGLLPEHRKTCTSDRYYQYNINLAQYALGGSDYS